MGSWLLMRAAVGGAVSVALLAGRRRLLLLLLTPVPFAASPQIHPHGAIQMRAYYKSRTEIRSVLDTENEDK